MNCPFCDDKEKKFAINISTGAWNCLHINSCGRKGSWYDFQKQLGDEPEQLYGSVFYQPKPKTYTLPKTNIKPMTSPIYEYLKSRKITMQTANRFKIGSENGDTIVFPYYKNGLRVNAKYRNIKDKKIMRQESGCEPVLFGRDLIADTQSLIICEGEFDALALWEYEIEAVSVPNGAGNNEWLTSEWDYIDTFKTIYLMFDMDNAGISAARDLANKIGIWKCRLIELPFKDANECLLNGVTRDTMCECVENAIELQPVNLVSADAFRQDVQDLFKRGKTLYGIETAWEGLTELLKGWRECELTIWSGRNSSGKSTILNQHFLYMLDQKIKCCVASLELPPPRYLRWAIIQQKQNPAPSPSSIDDCMDWFSDKLFIINKFDRMNGDEILQCFEYAARRYDCKHFILDSLMKIKLNGHNEYDAQYDFINQLKSFAEKYKCHVHLVAHPRKGEKDTDTPGKVDVKGSSHLTDIADNVLVLWRLEPDQKQKANKKGKPADMVLFVKKNREFGTEGSIRMMFNEDTKRFSDSY